MAIVEGGFAIVTEGERRGLVGEVIIIGSNTIMIMDASNDLHIINKEIVSEYIKEKEPCSVFDWIRGAMYRWL